VVVGNPPFLGAKLLRANLGDEYVEQLFAVFGDRLAGMSDLCAYWHEKARAQIEAGQLRRSGLLATQGIRGGRDVLERIKRTGDIFFAYADEPWVLAGANVHISFVGQDDGSDAQRTLNGRPVESINADLTSGVDLTRARRLSENAGIAFIADVKGGPFEIDDVTARAMLTAPNPDGRSNSDVVRPWVNGLDVTRRPRSLWIIDFGLDMPESEAALYEAPFEYSRRVVKPERQVSRTTQDRWWIHERPGHSMRRAIAGLGRYIGTAILTKHRLFVWLGPDVLPDHQLVVFARDDDYTFGVLHCRVHEAWARGMGTQLREVESGFRYTPTTCFETFPFPRPRTPSATPSPRPPAISTASAPAGSTRPGLSDADLAKRTLTNLYNARPTWLAQAHERLDAAVLAAYGWPEDIAGEDLLARLLELNLARADTVGTVDSKHDDADT
jgi:hypothetical protein